MKKTNTITTNVTSTALTNFHSKKSKYCTYSFISDQITIDNHYYCLLSSKAKTYNIKWKTMNF